MQQKQEWPLRKSRHPVVVTAVVHRKDGSTAPVTLTDLSDEGCRIDTPNDLRIGERLKISIPRMGSIKAQVRWALPDCAGARFLVESDV